MQNISLWVKKQYRKYIDIPELIGIYYDPYNQGIAHTIKMFITEECKHQVYGHIEN